MALIAESNPIAGTAFVTRNGVTLRVAGAASYRVANVERESKTGMSGVYGFIEKPIPGFIEIDVVDAGDTEVGNLANAVADTVVLELTNGKIVTGTSLWTTTASEPNAANGEFKVRWEGGSIRELLAA